MFEVPQDIALVPLEYECVEDTQRAESEASEEGAEFDAALKAEQQRREHAAAIQRARDETRAAVLAECEERMRDDLSVEHSALAHACTSFAQARGRYFLEVEREVVQLAMAIAGRILQREVSMDPTLLAGVVRVAMSKLADKEGAVLHVPERETEMWRRAMKSTGLQVKGDIEIEPGELLLEAGGGMAELGVGAQLVEIERGFFDLLNKRPA
jgi:flagellar assembly protein FliH